jgi:tetratricopeptide (TPR) repeat protein
VVAGAPTCQERAAACGATEAVAAHIAEGRFAHRVDVTQELFGVLNALRRPAAARAAPGVLPALRAAMARHARADADCAQRLLVQLRNLAEESEAAAAQLGDEGFVEAVLPLTDAPSSAVCACANSALAALTAGCAANAARAAAEASGEAAAALAPLFARLEASERAIGSPSGFDAHTVERTGASLRAAAAALPPHLAATPRGRELAARAAHLWARAAMSTDGDAAECCEAFRLALAHASAHANCGISAVEVMLPYGQALSHLGRSDDAEALLRQALTLCRADPAQGPHAWAVVGALGNVLLRAGHLDEALAAWAEALAATRAASQDPASLARELAASRLLRISMANACETVSARRFSDAARHRCALKAALPDACGVCLERIAPARPTAADGAAVKPGALLEVQPCCHVFHRDCVTR